MKSVVSCHSDELGKQLKKYTLQIAFGASQAVVKKQMEKDGKDTEQLDVGFLSCSCFTHRDSQ